MGAWGHGIRQDDYPLLAEEGVLAHATYVAHASVPPDDAVGAGHSSTSPLSARPGTGRSSRSSLSSSSHVTT